MATSSENAYTDLNLDRKVIIADRPTKEDLFGGAHQQITNSLYKIITHKEQKGLSIGLEGGRGAGKSTIVNLLKEKLIAEKQGKKIAVVTLDTWSQSGTHLHRSFIETLAEQLLKKRWLNSNKWRARLGRKSNLKIGAGLTSVIAILVALWLLIPDDIQKTYYEIITCWVGLNVDEALLWLGFSTLLLIAFFQHKWLRPVLNALSGNMSEIAIDHARQEAEQSSWLFQKWFEELTMDALNDQSRKLVIVLDNLDRIAKEDALETWKSLQIFFEKLYQNDPDRPHLKRIFFINCYDTSQLETEECEHFEKLINIRFVVPPLTIDHWHIMAAKIFEQRGFSQEEINSICDKILLIEGRKSPSPRDLVRCANELRVLDNQYSDHPVTALLLYWYELNHEVDVTPPTIFDESDGKGSVESTRMNFLEKLRSNQLYIRDEHILGMTRREAVEIYAEFYFALPKNLAIQALLHDPIANALENGDHEELARYAEQAVGYEAVLRLELENALKGYLDFARLSKLVQALYGPKKASDVHERCIDIFSRHLPVAKTDLYQGVREVRNIAKTLYLLIERLSEYTKLQQEFIGSFGKLNLEDKSDYKALPNTWVAFMLKTYELLDGPQREFLRPELKGSKEKILETVQQLYTQSKNFKGDKNEYQTFISTISLPAIGSFLGQSWSDPKNDVLFRFLLQKDAFKEEQIEDFLTQSLSSKVYLSKNNIALLLSDQPKGSVAKTVVATFFSNAEWIKIFQTRINEIKLESYHGTANFFPFILKTLSIDMDYIEWVVDHLLELELFYEQFGAQKVIMNGKNLLEPDRILTRSVLERLDYQTARTLNKIFEIGFDVGSFKNNPSNQK